MRVLGMGLGGGNDGGVVATSRKFMVSLKKREEKVDATEQAAIKWHLCALSASPLRLPVKLVLATVAPQPVQPSVLAFRADSCRSCWKFIQQRELVGVLA